MSIDFTSSRLSYEKDELIEAKVTENPLTLFSQWMEHALVEKVVEPYAMSIATCGLDMKPSVRTVLLREVVSLDENDFGVIFYTNYDSTKGKDLAENANAEVLFFWQELERQVRISGKIAKTSVDKSSDYFHKRPHTSQVAAWVSEPQSGIVVNREALDSKFKRLLDQYPEASEVPKPEFWGGYQLVAEQVEFWQGRASRMHDRVQYTKQADGNWSISRLMP